MNKRKPIVGEKLFRLNIGNAARHKVPQVLTPVIVSKVGRKYFTVESDDRYGFESEHHVEDWREKTNYCQDAALYETEQEWEDEKEAALIHSMIRQKVAGYGPTSLSLAQLRAIKAILETNQ